MGKKGKKRISQVPEKETKAERFIRVVKPRVAKTVKAINQIGLCSASSYEYTAKQLHQIDVALTEALNAMHAKFAGKKAVDEEFTFKE